MPLPTPDIGSISGIYGSSSGPYRGMSFDIGEIQREVEKGLPNEYKPRIDRALRNKNFYEGETEQYLTYNEAESYWDHAQRTKRLSNITRRIIDVLCAHLYNPGPSRKVSVSDDADRWLQGAYEANHVDALLRKADHLSTLNDVACLQIAASGEVPTDFGVGPRGNDADPDSASDDPQEFEAVGDAPILIHLLGAEEFAVWCHPSRPTKPWAVCTITRFDERRRFQLWTRNQYWTYYTDKLSTGQTAGGRLAKISWDECGNNPYNVLPFVFIHYEMPVGDFWTRSPGNSIAKAHSNIERSVSDLGNAIRIYISPQCYAYNVRSEWKPVIRPGGISHVPGSPDLLEQGLEPRIEFAQPQVDISGGWEDISNYRDCLLEDNGVPRSAVRMEQTRAASGAAIIAEQEPLLTRAKGRREKALREEKELSATCLAVAGYYYGRDDLVSAAADPQFNAVWPAPDSPIPGVEENQNDEWEEANGYASKITILMRRRGFTREESERELGRIMEDKRRIADLEKKYGLDPASQMAEQQQAMGRAEGGGGGSGGESGAADISGQGGI